jgi:hypothetical protein
VDCGRAIDFDPRPFEGVKKKPLAPGNSAFQMEMPYEVQYLKPIRCEPCRIAHTLKWERRKRQLPWLIAMAVLLLGLSLWLLLKS